MTFRLRAPDVTATTVLAMEKESIRSWVYGCRQHLTGRVLDYGSGRQPYRNIVEEAGGEYVPHDRTSYPSSVATEDDPLVAPFRYDAILCNQVLQYIPLYQGLPDAALGEQWVDTPLYDRLLDFHEYLTLGVTPGWLVMTGGTCWREIEAADHSRLTVAGIGALLEQLGFRVERCESRAAIDFPGFSLSLGWGVLAQA